jgi:hypothetical protein
VHPSLHATRFVALPVQPRPADPGSSRLVSPGPGPKNASRACSAVSSSCRRDPTNRPGGRPLTFEAGDSRVSGEQAGSTWDQFGRAAAGRLAGTRLPPATAATVSCGSTGPPSTPTPPSGHRSGENHGEPGAAAPPLRRRGSDHPPARRPVRGRRLDGQAVAAGCRHPAAAARRSQPGAQPRGSLPAVSHRRADHHADRPALRGQPADRPPLAAGRRGRAAAPRPLTRRQHRSPRASAKCGNV